MGVLHGAIAIVKRRGQTIGRIRNIRITENMRRADVRGLGTILTQETPVVEWAGSFTCSFYEIDYSASGVPDAIRRDVQTSQEFEDNLVLDQDEGLQIDVFKKVEDLVDPNGIRVARPNIYCVLKRCFIESDGVDVSEGTVAGRDQTFRFLDPIIFPS